MKKTFIITGIIIILSMIILYIYTIKDKEYSKNIFYMDTYINVKIYVNDKNKANKVLNEIEDIYKEYHMLTDRYNGYIGINNVYEINNSKSKDEYLIIDKKLCDLIKYGYEWFDLSNGLININIGNQIDIWKKYRENKNGIPTIKELKYAGSSDIKNVILKGNKIKNNNPNLDLGSVAKGYTTEIAKEYLEQNNIKKYIINAGGNIIVGEKYHKDKYKVGIQSPINKNDIFKVVSGENIAVVTSGSYERYYEYNEKKYHHIIDPNTFMPPNYVKSVTIITDDSKLADILSTTLFLMSIEDGKKFIKNYQAEVIWYTNDNKIVTTEGINKYE